MTRGVSKQRQIGARKCLIKGESAEKSTLIRFVLSPDNIVTPDVLERLDGRGVWVSADRDALDEAVNKKAFSRGFKAQVEMPEDLLQTIDRQLCERAVSLIAIARKAGQAFSGAEKTAQALQNGEVTVLFQASDGSEREKRNLSYRKEVDSRFECLNRRELGMAFAKENVVHAALTGEGLANRVKEAATRLSLLRGGSPLQD